MRACCALVERLESAQLLSFDEIQGRRRRRGDRTTLTPATDHGPNSTPTLGAGNNTNSSQASSHSNRDSGLADSVRAALDFIDSRSIANRRAESSFTREVPSASDSSDASRFKPVHMGSDELVWDANAADECRACRVFAYGRFLCTCCERRFALCRDCHEVCAYAPLLVDCKHSRS